MKNIFLWLYVFSYCLFTLHAEDEAGPRFSLEACQEIDRLELTDAGVVYNPYDTQKRCAAGTAPMEAIRQMNDGFVVSMADLVNRLDPSSGIDPDTVFENAEASQMLAGLKKMLLDDYDTTSEMATKHTACLEAYSQGRNSDPECEILALLKIQEIKTMWNDVRLSRNMTFTGFGEIPRPDPTRIRGQISNLNLSGEQRRETERDFLSDYFDWNGDGSTARDREEGKLEERLFEGILQDMNDGRTLYQNPDLMIGQTENRRMLVEQLKIQAAKDQEYLQNLNLNVPMMRDQILEPLPAGQYGVVGVGPINNSQGEIVSGSELVPRGEGTRWNICRHFASMMAESLDGKSLEEQQAAFERAKNGDMGFCILSPGDISVDTSSPRAQRQFDRLYDSNMNDFNGITDNAGVPLPNLERDFVRQIRLKNEDRDRLPVNHNLFFGLRPEYSELELGNIDEEREAFDSEEEFDKFLLGSIIASHNAHLDKVKSKRQQLENMDEDDLKKFLGYGPLADRLMRKQVPLTLAHCQMYESMTERLEDEETNQMITEMVVGVVAGVGCFAATVATVGLAAPVCIAGGLVEMGLMGSNAYDQYQHILQARVAEEGGSITAEDVAAREGELTTSLLLAGTMPIAVTGAGRVLGLGVRRLANTSLGRQSLDYLSRGSDSLKQRARAFFGDDGVERAEDLVAMDADDLGEDIVETGINNRGTINETLSAVVDGGKTALRTPNEVFDLARDRFPGIRNLIDNDFADELTFLEKGEMLKVLQEMKDNLGDDIPREFQESLVDMFKSRLRRQRLSGETICTID